MLGIIGAMDVEVNSIKSELENVEIKNIAAMDFYKGTLAGKEVVVVKCGIGKVNAAICAQILVSVFGVSALVNTGVAGSLNNDINICSFNKCVRTRHGRYTFRICKRGNSGYGPVRV